MMVEFRNQTHEWAQQRADEALYFAYGWNFAHKGDDRTEVNAQAFQAHVYKHEITKGTPMLALSTMFTRWREERA